MRIALFAETYVGSINGVMSHLKTLKDGLEELGHQVLIVTADKHCRHHYIEDGILHCPALESKRFYGFGVAPPYSPKRQRLIAQFDPDIIHIHQEFGIGLSGIYAARKLRKPLIYTLHTLYDHYVYYIAPKMFLRLATKFSHKYERFIADRATALTSPSPKGMEYLRRIGVEKELSVVPNVIDLEVFNPDRVTPSQKSQLRLSLGIDKDKTVAVFVGRLGREKSVDVLLEFWADTITKDDGLHLIIIGDGPASGELKALAAALGISGAVTFVGLCAHGKIPPYLASADVYITASLSDTNSISMLEGMAMGLLTLHRYDELNADQINTGVNGYFFNSADEMAKRLREIRALPPEELAYIKRQVRETVRHRGCTDLARFMLEIYESTIKQKNNRTPPKNRKRSAVY